MREFERDHPCAASREPQGGETVPRAEFEDLLAFQRPERPLNGIAGRGAETPEGVVGLAGLGRRPLAVVCRR